MAIITTLRTIRVEQYPNCIWVEVETDDGLVGLGEAWRGAAAIEAAAGPDAVVVHDIPLLAESDGAAGTFDAVIVVDVPPEVQVSRMVEDRGWTREDAEARIAAQATREQRRAIATYVVENTGTREDLRQRVTEVFEALTGGTGRAG